ncbi:pentatricopeptide repeat-containing protein At1g62260, mitochondrial-like [Selaginella moellendorffii]|uniref:pentatricopeptide repeat-containing protein At1g62260, mitochondrial-like n=1 Tax=Selaginella moellendorffii TaxID=88036 RepID=UPI000D1CF977|nr:pentatricopeptide repeat-containing protein At1g62260, mitochondrial-like [Selaginella moellendorffii]|eukprot:XP_024538387.1 pentatricopeptide repeat-containing protein At1g62260, mitochondrial-like [Selaginella moellendorffii]
MGKLLPVKRNVPRASILGILERFGDGFVVQEELQDRAEARPLEQRLQLLKDTLRIKRTVALLERWELQALDPLLYRAFMRLCARSKALEEGQRIHAHLASRGYSGHRFLASELVIMYGRCERLDLAKIAFESIKDPDTWSYNCLLAALTSNGHLHPAIELFERIPDRDIVSWNTMLQAFVRLGFFQEARDLFLEMPDRNAVSWTIMLTAYARNQRLDEAMEFLDAMPDRNAVSWNVMIAAFGHSGDGNLDMPIEIFRMMLLDGVPPVIGTFVTIFGVLGLLMDVKLGSEIHGLVLERGLGANLHVMNAVLRMYTACQSLEDCERTLESMEARDTSCESVPGDGV